MLAAYRYARNSYRKNIGRSDSICEKLYFTKSFIFVRDCVIYQLKALHINDARIDDVIEFIKRETFTLNSDCKNYWKILKYYENKKLE